MANEIRNPELWESGARKIAWVKRNMPLLNGIEKEFEQEKPFAGLRVALSVHLEAKTAYLCKVLAAGGAEMYVTGSNPLSTQDDVAAALVHDGLNVFAWYDATNEEYHRHISQVIKARPNVIIDDGGDLVNLIHNEYPELIPEVLGGCEETTTGIHRLKARAKAGALPFPMMNVNDAKCKHYYDNKYGTGQSVWDAIMHTTNLLVAGRTVVVAGYGYCGRGIAMRAKGMGATVIVTEIDPIKALEATMDGYMVMTMDEAAPLGDIFVTATGCRDVITKRHFEKMKNNAFLSNAGHFNVEVNEVELREMATKVYLRRDEIMGYELADGRTLNLLAEGRLVNLASGNGHPAEIMDMSFAIQSMSLKYLMEHRAEMQNDVYEVPAEIDDLVSKIKLDAMGLKVDTLTDAQVKYLNGWEV